MIEFENLCCTPKVLAMFKDVQAQEVFELELGRVVSLDRGFPLVNLRKKQVRAELATTIMKSEDSIVAIGDWVAVEQPKSHEKAIIRVVLRRKNEIARIKRVGREGQTQRHVLAANVDRVLICQAVSGSGLDLKLATRQITAVFGCDAQPFFVLTKCDLASSRKLERACAQLKDLFPSLSILCVAACSLNDRGDAQELSGIDAVNEVCPRNTSTLLLGESGVGKSTLANALLGSKKMQTAQVRQRDNKGRHTTVARQMLAIPNRGLLIDAPGLRTLQIMNMPYALKKAFPDVYEAALNCKFSDCTHTHEPGCVVQERIGKERLKAFVRLSKFQNC